MLRWVFIVLLLVNVIFGILFFQELRALFFSDLSQPLVVDDIEQAPPPRQIEINSQEVTAVTTDRHVCIEVRGFANPQAMESTKQWLKDQGLFAREKTRVVVTEEYYRVYVGKFASRAEAQKGLDLLRQHSKGFKGSVVFQYAPADWRMSLNVFPTQEQAEKYLASTKTNIEGLNAEIESQRKGQEEIYLVMTNSTAEEFLQNYQSETWYQALQQGDQNVDQCLAH